MIKLNSLILIFGLLGNSALALPLNPGDTKVVGPENRLKNLITYNGYLLAGSKRSSLLRFTGRVFNDTYTRRCTGVLIHERFVLLAGHCFEKMNKIVVEFALDDKASKFETIDVVNFIQHENAMINDAFNFVISDYETNKTQDLGLMLLARKPKWAKPLFVLDNSMTKLAEYTLFTRLTGYSRKKNFEILDDLTYVEMANVEQLAPGSNYVLYHIKDDQGICRGDSGGPTVITVQGNHYLVGITAAYKGGAYKDLPGAMFEIAKGDFRAICSQKAIVLHTGLQLEWIRYAMKRLAFEAKSSTTTDLESYILQ